MKKNIIYIIALCFGLVTFASCTDDLNQSPHAETTSGDVYDSVSNYESVLAKLYASFVITGQEKGGGNVDLTSNSGQDYMRCYFNLQECGTDELASTWLEGDKVKDLTYLSWDANDPWVSDMYYRIYYTIALCNEFIRNASDTKISAFSESDQTTIKTYRAEARFLRALAYYHALDLFHQGPFVTENDPVGAYTPPSYSSTKLFSYIESELKSIDTVLSDRADVEYGHAPRAAAWSLLAKLYLNAEVYTDTAHYTDCITYCNKVIADGYSLDKSYKKLFNADNDKRTDEIIFPLCVDATHTVSWGSTTYIICGEVSNTSTYQKAADYGVTTGWGMFRIRGDIPDLFDANDGRGLFFTEGQTKNITTMDDQTNGYFVSKWTNLTDAGEAASSTATGGVNTDFPLFRLGDVYLMLGESVWRGGTGATKVQALQYINWLRERAYGNTSGDLKENDINTDFFLDERARELYWEATRRTDLIRFGKFTTASYLWEWKGGVLAGKAVANKYNIYPIPATDIVANPNLSNKDY